MSTLREQVQEIVNSDLKKDKKTQMLKELGLSDSDIRQQLFAFDAKKKKEKKDAEGIVKEQPKKESPAKKSAKGNATKKPKAEGGKVTKQVQPQEPPHFFDHYDAPNKENTLYLTIKQVYFDAIIDGSKKEEFREIKDTTFRKYLQCDKQGYLLFDPTKADPDDRNIGDPLIWNNGDYPYVPRFYQYLNLGVGYAKDRDTALVKVVNFAIFPAQNEDGSPIRLAFRNDELVADKEGEFCQWVISYYLGDVVELHRKGK